MNEELWEILVPASNNKDKEFSYEHHKAWDAFVKNITGGLTVMKTAKRPGRDGNTPDAEALSDPELHRSCK